MGEAGTGKSCLIKRYCEEKFVSKYISTIGVDFGGTLFPCTHKYAKNINQGFLYPDANDVLPMSGSEINSGRQPSSKGEFLGFSGRSGVL